ncbi:uncharacterized protein zbbx isoform X3 [Dicentrarchus labrax]|uniref:uncharacterized protein zbbx isoform X3 n=1 Tax=Dicentrarchus labrax TaxID=13489 RepID=UPI0021F67545|nr:uncharacterized protein zbbx isoform X3 [Dicentrarchus labrax]
MNLNDFVVLPHNKAKSVKLNARNLQELQMETVTLGQESKDMEEKLQQLKESMSKEKEERGHSGRFRWKSGQCGSLNSNATSTKMNKENRLQKLSAGKVKIRVLKDEPLTAPPQPPPPPPPIAVGLRTTRRNRLKGKSCGQCEVKTAELMCAECTEDYCVGCFAKFHQKGALKLHRMIPIQADLQTHVSTRDVVSCFQKQISPSSPPALNPSPNSKPSPSHTFTSNGITKRGNQSPENGTEAVAKPMPLHPDPSQVFLLNYGGEKNVEMIEEGLKRKDQREFPTCLLRGEYDEEESARSFQEALSQWRGERTDGTGEAMTEDAMWTPVRPDRISNTCSLVQCNTRTLQQIAGMVCGEANVGDNFEVICHISVSAMATQTDLASDRGAEGQGRRRRGGEDRVPVTLEFTKNSLTYMDRLLLKKHRRTPIEMYHPSLATVGTDLNSLTKTNNEEETESSLTAQEEDFRRYCASLFAVPVSRGRIEPQITTPESCLIIEVLDEGHRDIDGDFVAEQRTDKNRMVPSVQQVLSKGKTLVPQTAFTSAGSSRVRRLSPSSTQSYQQSRAPAQPKAAQKSHLTKPQTQAEHSRKSSSSKSKPSVCPTAETPRTSKTSIKTPTPTSQKPNCSPTVHKSKPDHGSPRLLSSPSLPHSQTEIPKSSHGISFQPDAFPLASARPPIPEEYPSPSSSISFSLGCTFTVSPSGSTETTLLPKVYQSTPLQKASDSSPLPEQCQSPKLFPEPISSLKLSQPPPSNLESPRQSQYSFCDPESLLSDDQLQLPLSHVSYSPNPIPKSLEQSPPLKTLSCSSLLKESPPGAYSKHRSTPANEDAPVFMSSTPISGDHESSLSPQDTQCIPSLPLHLLNVIKSSHLTVKMEEEEELSIEDSGDEMSSDSLGLAPDEEDSSDEEAEMCGCLTRGRSGEEEQRNTAIPHLEESFVPTNAERKKALQMDEQEQLSEPSMEDTGTGRTANPPHRCEMLSPAPGVMHKQSAGSGSEQFCDLDGFSPLGLDMNSGHSDTPEHTHCDSLHTRQTFPYDSDPTGSEGYEPSSSLSICTEEHLVFEMMKDTHTQPTGIQIHSTKPTRRGEISENELGTSGSGSHLPGKSTPTLSRVPAACCLPRPTLGSDVGPAFRPLSGAAQEIMEICSVDQMGCEDPDLDTETTAHTVHELEQELKLMAKGADIHIETGKQASEFGAGNSGSQEQHGNHHFTRGRVSEEQRDEEAAAQRDQQSVLLLP